MKTVDDEIEECKKRLELLEKKKQLVEGRQLTKDQMIQIQKNISARIKQLRKVSGVKQEELAELIGCSRTSVSNIERGEHMPTLPTIFRIIVAIGCNVSDIFKDGDIKDVM